MQDHVRGAILGSFVADAMGMGVEFENDPQKIQQQYGRLEDFVTPKLQHHHEGKKAGDLSHYGDQALELLISVVAKDRFDAESFMVRWRALMKSDYPTYKDGTSQKVLQEAIECNDELDKCGTASEAIGGAVRIAPLVYAYGQDTDSLKQAAKEQATMTHNSHISMLGAAFVAEVTAKVLGGQKPTSVIKELAGAEEYAPISSLITQALQCSIDDPVDAIARLGSDDSVKQALPASIYLIQKYEDNFKEAIVQNTMAGGDTAARGMIIGTVLGAYHGLNALPAGWLEGLQKQRYLEDVLAGNIGLHYYEYENVEKY